MAQITIDRISGTVGAELGGVDLSSLDDEGVWGEIRQALFEHGVIFFRGQHLDPPALLRVGREFGNPSPYHDDNAPSPVPGVPGYPELEVLHREPDAKGKVVGEHWHTDQIFREKPTRATMLYAVEVPEAGGDTLFSSSVAAYSGLSPGLKRTLESLRAVHQFGAFRRGEFDAGPTVEATHPVIIRLPESGKRALYVGANATIQFEGWTREESRGLLQYLFCLAPRPEFGCRYRWQKGSLAIWDNFQVLHYATNDYAGHRRSMQRLTVEMSVFSEDTCDEHRSESSAASILERVSAVQSITRGHVKNPSEAR